MTHSFGISCRLHQLFAIVVKRCAVGKGKAHVRKLQKGRIRLPGCKKNLVTFESVVCTAHHSDAHHAGFLREFYELYRPCLGEPCGTLAHLCKLTCFTMEKPC